ncbi:MAG TPA: EcoRI family type II restriction endonuclease [Solirubrobacteraceae bacterium]|nr:EcoRI family type II restriction endonuclease [Solirubrobacteraceae bacterium]
MQRAGTVINMTSSKQETELGHALTAVVARIQEDFAVPLHHDKAWMLADIVSSLKADFSDVRFAHVREDTSMKPDGGILSIVDRDGGKHVVLIVEVKNQGTNDARAQEGKPKQAKGNAIERLGKNVIGFRTAMLTEGIMPFVCFGYGCDFADDSSILDRVITMAMFGPLNEICVVNLGEGGVFNRGSFFFREPEWSREEMEEVMYEVANRSIHYYLAKLGEDAFASARSS